METIWKQNSVRGQEPPARDVLSTEIVEDGGLMELRDEHHRLVPASRQLCRQDYLSRVAFGKPPIEDYVSSFDIAKAPQAFAERLIGMRQ